MLRMNTCSRGNTKAEQVNNQSVCQHCGEADAGKHTSCAHSTVPTEIGFRGEDEWQEASFVSYTCSCTAYKRSDQDGIWDLANSTAWASWGGKTRKNLGVNVTHDWICICLCGIHVSTKAANESQGHTIRLSYRVHFYSRVKISCSEAWFPLLRHSCTTPHGAHPTQDSE